MSYRDYEPVDLQRAGFKIHQLEGFEKDNIENAFAGYVLKVLGKINDGKEATVYLCRTGRDSGFTYAAAKIFKSRTFRHFDTDRNYRDFGKMRDRRLAKLMRGRGGRGDQVFHRQWVKSEWHTLNALHKLGVRVPIPIAEYDDGVLMEYIGTLDGAAPRLIDCRLDETKLKATAEKLYHDIEIMLADDIVHGDLSPYNILYHGEPVIIDVPQAMDLRTTPKAYSMMQRDLTNLDRYFKKKKIEVRFLDLMKEI
jgi:RIO kinase 1|tara:strand:+ start:3858 stop:4616 length:759 start_codon:yes stop_codon:yes gene_type:complete